MTRANMGADIVKAELEAIAAENLIVALGGEGHKPGKLRIQHCRVGRSYGEDATFTGSVLSAISTENAARRKKNCAAG